MHIDLKKRRRSRKYWIIESCSPFRRNGSKKECERYSILYCWYVSTLSQSLQLCQMSLVLYSTNRPDNHDRVVLEPCKKRRQCTLLYSSLHWTFTSYQNNTAMFNWLPCFTHQIKKTQYLHHGTLFIILKWFNPNLTRGGD